MNDAIIGLLGVGALFLFTFMWVWVEERLRMHYKRKYDEQIRKYDTWRNDSDSM
jgi:hypothetical protein